MNVWIDQDLCTGCGMCAEHVPAVFVMLDDGLPYVRDSNRIYNDPGGMEGRATAPAELLDAVLEAAAECPGEIISIDAI